MEKYFRNKEDFMYIAHELWAKELKDLRSNSGVLGKSTVKPLTVYHLSFITNGLRKQLI